ncbi:MAG: hypothetical protein ACOX4D_00240 [Bacteroidales bacterium]|jgi:hypothetical protein
MNSETSYIQSIHEILSRLDERTSKVEAMIENQSKIYAQTDDMELSSAEIMRFVGISRAELGRWRANNVIPFRYISANHVAYPFKGVYAAIKSGRATFRGFRKIEALRQLEAFRDGAVKNILENSNE